MTPIEMYGPSDPPPAIVADPPGRHKRRAWLIVAGAALAVTMVALVAGHPGPLTTPKAAVLGAVEGLTEYLPVSSTGHLVIVERLLGVGDGAAKDAADTYAIAIQLGAIAAVAVLFWHRIAQLAAGLAGRDRAGRRLLIRLAVAFAPAALVGAVFDQTIKDHLYGPWPIIVAWFIGGLFLLSWTQRSGSTSIDASSIRDAAIIGAAQALALWPGVSRSLVTIVAALAVGCDIIGALEFSFLLGLVTLSAATALDLAKHGHALTTTFGWTTPLLGGLVAFVTALAAVRWVVGYLRTRPLTGFGWYRIAIALATVVLIGAGAI